MPMPILKPKPIRALLRVAHVAMFAFGSMATLAAGVASPALVAAETVRPSTVAVPSRFEIFEVALPALDVDRKVRVYLPRGYTNCEGCRYPVVYFMDGQNVFDAATSYAGEWGADEILDELLAKHDLAVIAVGVDHGGAARMQELSVWENPEFRPTQGEAYLADLVGAVKPAIDARYRTRPAPASTTIVGSSMGGLMAHAAVLRHPEVFGGALIFSPSYWFSPAIAEEAARTPLRPGQAVLLYAGGAESDTMLSQARAMYSAMPLRSRSVRMTLMEDPKGEHNEAAWRKVLPVALCWRFDPICAPR